MDAKTILGYIKSWWDNNNDPYFNSKTAIVNFNNELKKNKISFIKCLSIPDVSCNLQWLILLHIKRHINHAESKIENKYFINYYCKIKELCESDLPLEIKEVVLKKFIDLCLTKSKSKKDKSDCLWWYYSYGYFIYENRKAYFKIKLNKYIWERKDDNLSGKIGIINPIIFALGSYFEKRKVKVKNIGLVISTFLYIACHDFYKLKPIINSKKNIGNTEMTTCNLHKAIQRQYNRLKRKHLNKIPA